MEMGIMKITKRQLRRIIREAADTPPPRTQRSPRGPAPTPEAFADQNGLQLELDNEGQKIIYLSDEQADRLDIPPGVNWDAQRDDDGWVIYTGERSFPEGLEEEMTRRQLRRIIRESILKEGNSPDPRGLKALLAALNVKGREFGPVSDALSTAYHDFEGGPQDMKDEVETNSGGLPTTAGDWIDWPVETYQEIWDLYEKARQEYKSPQASGPRF